MTLWDMFTTIPPWGLVALGWVAISVPVGLWVAQLMRPRTRTTPTKVDNVTTLGAIARDQATIRAAKHVRCRCALHHGVICTARACCTGCPKQGPR